MKQYKIGDRVLIKTLNVYGSIIEIVHSLFLVRYFYSPKYQTKLFSDGEIQLSNKLHPEITFEIFPPKDKELSIKQIESLVYNISKYNPPFISVTYGAMGSTKSNSSKVAKTIRSNGIVPLSHITCYNESHETIDKFLNEIKNEAPKLLILRGDKVNSLKSIFNYSTDLLEYIKDTNYEKGVAAYVEGHPESKSISSDIEILKEKVSLGAKFAITQMFFDCDLFFSFMDKIDDIPIDIKAGIMPVTKYLSLTRIKDFGNITIPHSLIVGLETAKNEEEEFNIGINFAYNQILNLIKAGYDHIHIYTMNKIKVVNKIMELLDGEI